MLSNNVSALHEENLQLSVCIFTASQLSTFFPLSLVWWLGVCHRFVYYPWMKIMRILQRGRKWRCRNMTPIKIWIFCCCFFRSFVCFWVLQTCGSLVFCSPCRRRRFQLWSYLFSCFLMLGCTYFIEGDIEEPLKEKESVFFSEPFLWCQTFWGYSSSQHWIVSRQNQL